MSKPIKISFPGLGLRTPLPESRQEEYEEESETYESEACDSDIGVEDISDQVGEVLDAEEEEGQEDPDKEKYRVRNSLGRPVTIAGKPVYWTVDFSKLTFTPPYKK